MPTKPRLVIFCLIFSVCFASCSGLGIKAQGQKKFGADADYFIGLQLLRAGNEKEAALKFSSCVKKGSYYCAQKSAQELCAIGSVQEKNAACLKLIQAFPDSQNLLIAARQLFSSDEINKVIEITDGISLADAPNELAKIRLEAMKKRGDSRFSGELYEWFTSRAISKIHSDFFSDFIEEDFKNSLLAQKSVPDDIDSLFEDAENPLENDSGSSQAAQSAFEPKNFALNYRIQIYRKNYVPAYESAHFLLDYFESGELAPCAQIFSDIGKAFLYGSQDFLTNANYFKSMAERHSGGAGEHYFWFYAARLFGRSKNYRTQEKVCFLNAVNSAQDSFQKDNALWYLLNCDLQNFTDETLSSIQDYCQQWKDPSYFDDFFTSLVPLLFAAGRFNDFGALYKKLSGYASQEITGRFAYIYARLCQEGFADGNQTEVRRAFEHGLLNGNHVYYKLLSACRLGLSQDEIEGIILNYSDRIQQDFNPDRAAERLLEGYATFGFPELIYANYLELCKKGISADSAFYLANFLNNCGAENNDFYVQGIRLASRVALSAERPVSAEECKLLYPKGFESIVEKSCSEFCAKAAVIYALIRSESFFDADIKSHAGAVGLAQLMPSTAQDIAKRLKKSDYDLLSPEDNIRFGTYYFSELYGRCDNSYMQAFFSYNAGISKVRRWLQGSMIGFGKKLEMPPDLFLETLPYAETQEYGRKLVSAAAIYQLLYEGSLDFLDEVL